MHRCRETDSRDVQKHPERQEGLQLVLGQEQVLACPCRLPYPFQGLPTTHGTLITAIQDWHNRHVCVEAHATSVPCAGNTKANMT